jgi:putative hemolysin
MEDQPGEHMGFLISSVFVSPQTFQLPILAVIVLLILIVISGLISGSEIAYFSLNAAKVNSLKGKKAELVQWLWAKPEKLLATILIYNNLVNISIIILAAWLGGMLLSFDKVWMEFLVNVIIITSIIVFFCELLPKIIANLRPVAFARIMADPLRVGMFLIYPLVILLVRSTVFIDRRLKKKGVDISREDLNEAINYSAKNADSDEEETKLLKGIISFGDKEVTEIMTSRMDVVGIDQDGSFADVLTMIKESGFSRYPVYQDNIDNIVGILHIKDMLPFLDSMEEVPWQSKVRPVYVIPENKKIKDLLKEFQQKKKHMAVVVDEFGGANGIITLEDVIEEIVGDISDEFDDENDNIDYLKLGDNNFEFEGKILIHDFLKVLQLTDTYSEMAKGEADTLAGFLLEIKGDLPETNEKLIYENLTFTVKEVDQRRIIRIQTEYNSDEQ